MRLSLLVASTCAAATACATVEIRQRTPAADRAALSCHQIVVPASRPFLAAVQWHELAAVRSQPTLDAWCRGVGPIVYQSHPANSPDASSPVRETDAIAVVSWNVNVGAGNLSAFVADLQAGKWSDGCRVDRFVLLLQEALRTGDTVPARDPSQAGARRLLRGPPRIDIVSFARELGLSLFYVPSMRNGLDASAPAEDRGNAILSTLPLLAPEALELPFVRQRRVAVLATLGGLGESEPLGVASVHLDHLVGASRLWILGTAGWRARQARAITAILPHSPVVIGGDFNTWLGTDEPAVQEMTRVSGQAAQTREGTYSSGAVLDYLFFRTPTAWRATYERADHAYGSDHYPLIGWITPVTKSPEARASACRPES